MNAKNGQHVWIYEAVSAVTGSSNKSILRGVMVDITNLKKAETELASTALRLAESEKRLAGILDTAAIGIVTVDSDLRIISFNLEAEQIFGYSASDMIGQPLDRLIPDKHVGAHRRHMESFQTGESRNKSMGDWRTICGKAADGRDIPLSANISQVTVGGKSWLTAVMRDMTQTQRNEEELRRLMEQREEAMARAVDANQAKSSFLAVMSHELRTPLNAIIGFSDLMRAEIGGPVSNPTYKGYIEDIHQAGALLLGIINSILDLSRIESGKLELKMGRVCLKDAWVRIESTVQSHAVAKGIDLTFVEFRDRPLVPRRRQCGLADPRQSDRQCDQVHAERRRRRGG